MAIFATAGSKIFIGGPKVAESGAFDVSDFAGQSWQEIGWAEAIGEFGDESSEITFDAIGEGRTQKLKGIRNAGTMAARFGISSDDLGQIALRAAEAVPNDFAFRVDFNDAPVGGSPSHRYFVAKVMSAREVLDTANNVVRLNASLGVNSNIVQVQAAASM
jgi:hypothetical protein